VILEIGVSMGGSLQMWKHYFGPKIQIYAIDIDPKCKQFEDETTRIFIGSQSDRNFLKYVKESIPKVDILIDDGGHRMDEQIITFEELYGHVKDDGIYLCEDTHTSYWKEYDGGYKKRGSFVEYTKNLIDHLNAWHSRTEELTPGHITKSAHSLHFYDSVFVIEKKKRDRSWDEMRGSKPLPFDETKIQEKDLKILLLKLDLLGIELDSNIPPEFAYITPSYLENKFPEKYFGTSWPEDAVTMIGFQRLSNLEFCIKDVIENNIEGDLIETGVWKGGACIFMRAILDIFDVKDRKVWVADSFRGLPSSNAELYPDDEGIALNEFEELAISKDDVKNNFKKYNLLDDRVEFLEGWFKDTLPEAPVSKLSILRLDGDLYESTIDALFYLYPKLSVGGYCIIDDWGAIEACKRAVKDYRKFFGINGQIHKVDGTGVFWKKEKEIKSIDRDEFYRKLMARKKRIKKRSEGWIHLKQVIKNGIRNIVHID
jgi:hypothetical protein